MPPENADNTGHATSSEERQDRHQHIQRSLCGATAGTPREDRTHGGGTCRTDRNSDSNAVHLGEWEPLSGERRSADRCPSPQREREDALAERVKSFSAQREIELKIHENGRRLDIYEKRMWRNFLTIASCSCFMSILAVFVVSIHVIVETHQQPQKTPQEQSVPEEQYSFLTVGIPVLQEHACFGTEYHFPMELKTVFFV